MSPEQYIKQAERIAGNTFKVAVRVTELEILWAGAITSGNGAVEQDTRLKLHALLDQRLDLETEQLQLRKQFTQQ